MVFSSSKENPFRRSAAHIIDTVLPPQSLVTGDMRDAGADANIWSGLNFLDEPCCKLCGFPFEFDQGPEILCGRCVVKAPAYDMARAAFQYDDVSRSMILGFKHGGRTEGLSTFAAHMRRAGRKFLPQADVLIPVPLHYSRRIKRRYNQSALLARALARISRPQFDPDSLMRCRATLPQGGKSFSGRRRNVQGAFAVRDKYEDRIAGAHIVLIDDVMTTGATAESCARTLKRAGARRVDVLALARVVKAATIPK